MSLLSTLLSKKQTKKSSFNSWNGNIRPKYDPNMAQLFFFLISYIRFLLRNEIKK